MEIWRLNSKHVTHLIQSGLLKRLKLTCDVEEGLNPQILCSQSLLLNCNLLHQKISQLQEIAIQEITTFEQYTAAKFQWIDSNLRVQELRDYFYTSALKNYVKYDFHAEPDSIIQLGLTHILVALLMKYSSIPIMIIIYTVVKLVMQLMVLEN